jgi:predicted N-acetyltransferase YhbS
MIIRPVRYQDRDEIVRLLTHRKVFNEREVQVALEVFDDAFRQPAREDYQAFCACDGESHIVGYICFGPITVTDRCYDLYWLIVDEMVSRQGVGRKLLAFMEEYAAGKGARRVYIETSSTPPYEGARAFYQKQNYALLCAIKDFYRIGDDKLIFAKEVAAPLPPIAETVLACQNPRAN